MQKINLEDSNPNPKAKLKVCFVFLFLHFNGSLEFSTKNGNNDLNPPFYWIPNFFVTSLYI